MANGRWVPSHFKVEREEMGRSPCCSKEGLNRGAWTATEDKILTSYIKVHGEGNWRNLPKRAGLKRCGKSCRLRWLNYLRPDIKRGNISRDEEELILRLHKLLGNRWSLIAGRLPGRTDNEIKNYWNTTLAKKAKALSPLSPSQENHANKSKLKKLATESSTPIEPPESRKAALSDHKIQVIRTKATRCTKALVPLTYPPPIAGGIDSTNSTTTDLLEYQGHQSYLIDHPYQDSNNLNVQHGAEEVQEMEGTYESDLLNVCYNELEARSFGSQMESSDNNNYTIGPENDLQAFNKATTDCWTTACLEDNATMDLESFSFLLDPEQWPSQEEITFRV